LDVDEKPVLPTSLPPTEKIGGAAKLAGGGLLDVVCDEDSDASSAQIDAKPKYPAKRRQSREFISFSLTRVLSKSKNTGRADVP
jgi:hypothetical protein